ncbi:MULTISPECIES: nucleotide exchange factor GrpE [Rhizobium]|jgi:molecular chaperone GrpE|uniref:Protein GrpE n=3 Tax=Rhizobium TaxID=379 RepID=A0A1S9GXG4_9HYPH|nr:MULTISPECIES: nucleotide exchange factor GrpE [Rhizobium]EJC69112.1 molecular chaperone GrpE (heat shock protein) [Rhizobium leguminosarum bv. viciae WSM1455]AHF82132.1 heat shock protein GrpE [Rhizobium leguminosarum bv. trifolii WSM1689]ASR08192.1 nucleotide exchange factor GrpE [Rhizobium leguminosarum bv. viciae]KAF5882047.1 nucleotide exchange factor GrpE [Rhizobium sp. PEPV16]MBA5801968.1 nucleotide exchange factor GrpE [Rhizobium changzhiense]
MTDDTTKNGPDATAADAAADAAAYVENETAQQEPAQPDPIELLKAENGELRDRYLRLAAEMDNLRRRTEREVKDAKSYSVAGFARDMLAVSDNLRRALDAIPPETKAAADAGLSTLIEGVEMTERAMLSALERHGVRKLEPVGQKFDPNFHQAMFEVPNPDVPNNTVVQVVQAGFTIGERVLRPAMVGVAKGGPKPAEAETNSVFDEKDA